MSLKMPVAVAAVLSICLLLEIPAALTQTGNPLSADVRYGEPKELCRLKDARINESSGLASSILHKDAFWTHNDSGDSARVFLFNKAGDTLAVLQLKDAKAIDCEDIASFKLGRDSYVLVADVGDNSRRRSQSILYILREPAIVLNSESKEAFAAEVEPVWTLRFTFEDGARDCEAVAVDPTGSTIYLVSKELQECKVYCMPLPSDGSQDPAVAKAVATIKVPYATAMDISPDGMRAVVLTYTDAFEFVRTNGESWAQAFSREPRILKMPTRPQGESICFGPDGKTLYLTSENPSQPLWEISPAADGK